LREVHDEEAGEQHPVVMPGMRRHGGQRHDCRHVGQHRHDRGGAAGRRRLRRGRCRRAHDGEVRGEDEDDRHRVAREPPLALERGHDDRGHDRDDEPPAHVPAQDLERRGERNRGGLGHVSGFAGPP
jgi:hypothetical protein